MSSPSRSESLRDRLKLKGHFRKFSQDKSSTPSSSDSPSRPAVVQPTMSQTQILPPRSSRVQETRPSFGTTQRDSHPSRGSSGLKRSSSLEFPERLKHGDDAGEDVTKAHDPNFMNRSLLNMITAAGSSTQFHNRLDDISSDSEEFDDDSTISGVGGGTAVGQKDDATMSLPSLPKKDVSLSAKSSKRNLLQSVQRLRSIRERNSNSAEGDDKMSSSQILMPPKKNQTPNIPSPTQEGDLMNRDAPYLSMLLKGEAEMQAQQGTGSPARSSIDEQVRVSEKLGKVKSNGGPTLATRLMDIFDLKEPEEVIAEYPAWFLQTVLLSGYLYVTSKHICFYAYLPKNTQSAAKSGHLGKRGQHNPRYKRYYVELKGDVLRYYNDITNPYLPSGQIDLRYGISATIDPEKHKLKEESSYIKLVTKKREYFFRADSPQSARDWVKQLQRIIFRSHNDGDSVKILLPINNIIDMEANKFLEISDTIKLRVIDNDETYAVDEYFFSFFGAGREAVRVISILVEDNAFHTSKKGGKQGDMDQSNHSDSSRPSITVYEVASKTPRSVPVAEPVRATLLPHHEESSSRRSSFESRRSSAEVGRPRSTSRSSSRGREKESRRVRSPTRMMSEDSQMSDWNDHGTESSAAGVQSMADSNVSASQILNGSDVFIAPTSHVIPRSRSRSEESRSRRREQASTEKALQPQESGQIVDKNSGPSTVQSAFALNSILRAGSYPIGRASELANIIKDQSRRLSTQVTSQSMDYLEKISGMWQAPTRHYGPVEGMPSDDDDPNGTGNMDTEHHSQRFREHFALPDSERLVASYFGSFWRVLPLYGKIYISENYFCYRSMLPGTRTKLVLPLRDIESVSKKKASYRPGFPGLVITIRGHEEIFFDFSKVEARDDCTIMLILIKEAQKSEQGSTEAEGAIAEYRSLREARNDKADDGCGLSKRTEEKGAESLPILFDDPKASILNFKPAKPLRITCLTIGSRGDVQPYIALAKALQEDGHHVKIATHEEFGPWVESHGIEFAPVSGDPGELMRICIQYGMFTYEFLKEASSKFRGWIDDLLITAWDACQDTDLLIESPSAMAGIHIAEALQIPYFRAFTMPWTRTRAYPHAFGVPTHKQGGGYNYMSYVIIDGVFWKGIASNVNRWRRKTLHLPATSLDKMQSNKVPFLYNFSPHVVPPPLDFSDWIRITGYWFLDEGKVYNPPKEILAFIKKAKDDGKKLVYIGFGSILVEDPVAMTQTVIDAVLKADVRCILAKGWSNRVATSPGQPKPDPSRIEVPLPPEIYPVKSIPHDWLFSQLDAVAFHGGSGTMGAALRAGVPIIAKPFFGDQFFFGSRVEDLGVGICLRKLNSTLFGRALWEATRSDRMKAKAKALGEQIRAENGAANAVTAIYRDLEYARSLIKKIDRTVSVPEEIEEHWTFVEASASATTSEEEALAEEALRMSLEK